MKKLLVFVAVIATAELARAETILFDFSSSSGTNQAGLDLDGLVSGSSTVTGSFPVTLSASANTGEFNYTASSPNFGINATGGGDVTDAFDAGTGISEVATLSFTASTPATFTLVSIDFDRMTGAGLPGDDVGTLAFSGGSTTNFDATDLNASGLLTVGESFVAGQSISLSHIDGNGFGLEQITLEVNAIPEPTSAVIWLGLAFGGFALHQRKKRATGPHRT